MDLSERVKDYVTSHSVSLKPNGARELKEQGEDVPKKKVTLDLDWDVTISDVFGIAAKSAIVEWQNKNREGFGKLKDGTKYKVKVSSLGLRQATVTDESALSQLKQSIASGSMSVDDAIKALQQSVAASE